MHRPEDDELVGYLVPDADGCTPVTLFGHPLSGPTTRDEAEALLLRRGLPVLADPWWFDGDEGYRVQIMSADPESVVVARADFGFVPPDGERHRLTVPTDRLRPLR